MVAQQRKASRFYVYMGILLLILVVAGFGSVMVLRGRPISELPVLFHFHGLVYIGWFVLFIFQAHLISRNHRSLHMRLGYTSVVVVLLMVISGWLMASHAYQKDVSPIPNITTQQFLAFPLFDLLGLLTFYSLAVFNRHQAVFHKHAMLVTSIAIMDPAIARLAFSFGLPPAAIAIHLALIGLLVIHDRRVYNKVHMVTWLGLGWVILRLVLIFGVGKTDTWATMMDSLFG